MDAAIAFWWKPEPSHKHLYPTVKDADIKPVQCIVNGKVEYKVCPYGIEVFETRFMRKSYLDKPGWQ
eukprot:6202682-Pleurochrysis_carterae.AAC.1